MRVTSPDFENNGFIPKCCTGFGEDRSPELLIEDIPKAAVSLAVILDDLDVPFCRIFTHWIIWNIPPTERIPRGLPGGERISSPIAAVQGRAWGKHVYRGPKQPFFIKKAHRYVFSVYALDRVLALSPESDRAELVKGMSGNILAEVKLTGIYQPEKRR